MKAHWKKVRDDKDVVYEKWDGIAKITINRPEVRNAFRPQTLFELSSAFDDAREDPEVGVVILTGEGDEAFCSGGDQRVRGKRGLRRQRRRPPPQRARSPEADPLAPQAGGGDGGAATPSAAATCCTWSAI